MDILDKPATVIADAYLQYYKECVKDNKQPMPFKEWLNQQRSK